VDHWFRPEPAKMAPFITALTNMPRTSAKLCHRTASTNAYLRLDFVYRIWVAFHRLAQVLTRDDMHPPRILHNM
jgi:hypothetical protein